MHTVDPQTHEINQLIQTLQSFYQDRLAAPDHLSDNDRWRCQYALKELRYMQQILPPAPPLPQTDLLSTLGALNKGVEQFDDYELNKRHVQLNEQLYRRLLEL